MKNVAIVGFGRIGSGAGRNYKTVPKIWNPYSLYETFRLIPNIELIAVCDPNLQQTSNLPDEIQVFEKLDELLSTTKLDFMAVTTRTKERFEIIKKALLSGVTKFHIEKPLCCSRAELQELKILFHEHHAVFSYGTIRRHLNPYMYVKQLIENNEFGELNKIIFQYGEVPLFWSHPHSIDLALYFIRLHEKYAISKVSGTKPKLLNNCNKSTILTDPIISYLHLKFESGVEVVFDKNSNENIVLQFEKCNVIILNDGRRVIKLDESGSIIEIWNESSEVFPSGYVDALRGFISNTNETCNEYYKSTMLDAFQGQEMLFDICESLLVNDFILSDKSERFFLMQSENGLLA